MRIISLTESWDWLVQSKINDARRQVENAIVKVNYVMGQLQNL